MILYIIGISIAIFYIVCAIISSIAETREYDRKHAEAMEVLNKRIEEAQAEHQATLEKCRKSIAAYDAKYGHK
jgi:protein subunit release factor A